MARLQPKVLENISLERFMQHLLDNHGPESLLVFCGSKDVFLHDLQAAIAKPQQQPETEAPKDPGSPEDKAPAAPAQAPGSRPHPWTVPTLRLLASVQTLKLAFCEDVAHLRAFLAAYPHRNPAATASNDGQSPRLLALLNLIALHRPTSNFSAQGLNRSFSVAVDAAHASGSKLVVAECQSVSFSAQAEEDGSLEDVSARSTTGIPADRRLWDEEVSILNVATKTFGAGERGWVGRTVKLRGIASRWCVFEDCISEER